MCGRFTLKTLPQNYVDFMAGLKFPAVEPRYNIAPTQKVLCVIVGTEEDSPLTAMADSSFDRTEQNYWVAELSWGLVPGWEKQPATARRHFNARSETAAKKPSFSNAFKKRRCLILADGFYEWKSVGKSKRPFYVTPRQEEILWFAGLWEPGDPDQGPGANCTILTTEANRFMQPLHHRMPVILTGRDLATWLDNDVTDSAALQSMMKPCDEDRLGMRRVSTYVNNARHQGPACLDPPSAEQTSLF